MFMNRLLLLHCPFNKKNGAKFAQSLSLHAQIYASSSSYYGIIATAGPPLRLPTSLSVGFVLQLTFLAKPAQKSGSSGQTFPTGVEVAGLRYYQALQR